MSCSPGPTGCSQRAGTPGMHFSGAMAPCTKQDALWAPSAQGREGAGDTSVSEDRGLSSGLGCRGPAAQGGLGGALPGVLGEACVADFSHFVLISKVPEGGPPTDKNLFRNLPGSVASCLLATGEGIRWPSRAAEAQRGTWGHATPSAPGNPLVCNHSKTEFMLGLGVSSRT